MSFASKGKFLTKEISPQQLIIIIIIIIPFWLEKG